MLRMMVLGYLFFFFFKQKTAYEMRISDWSSDVCSSDLSPPRRDPAERAADIGERAQGGAQRFAQGGVVVEQGDEIEPAVDRRPIHQRRGDILPQPPRARPGAGTIDRTGKRYDRRRVGKECTCDVRSRWSPTTKKKKEH